MAPHALYGSNLWGVGGTIGVVFSVASMTMVIGVTTAKEQVITFLL